MPDIQTKDIYTNTTGKKLVGMSYEELYRYAEEEVFFDRNKLTKLYPKAKYFKNEGEKLLFFDYNKVDDLINTLREMDYSDTEKYLSEIEKYEMSNNMERKEIEYISIDFNYRNEMKHEEIKLGGKINVSYRSPESEYEEKMVEDVKNNVFFKALGAENLKFAVSENGDKGVVIENVFYDERFINKYLEKYPNIDESYHHSEPKADETNLIKAMQQQKQSAVLEM